MRKWLLFFCIAICIHMDSGMAERIWISTDLHISKDGVIQTEAFFTLLDRAKDGDALILLGDLANSGHLSEHQSILEGLERIHDRTAVFVLPGNHDLTAETEPEQFCELYAAYGYDQAFARDMTSLSYAVMIPGGICLLMLDVNDWDTERRNVMHGQIDTETAKWVETVLERLPVGTPVLVCGHYPLFPLDGTDTTKNANRLAKVLRDGEVLAYLCGHRHSNDTRTCGNVRQITVGAPWTYPAYIGMLEPDEGGYIYTAVPLFDETSNIGWKLAEDSRMLATRMAIGSLEGTSFENDAVAINWFERFFMDVLEGKLSKTASDLWKEDGFEHWKQAEVHSAVKPWILETMSSPPEDYHRICLR